MIYDKHTFRQLRRTIGANIHHRRAARKMPLRKLSRLTGVPSDLLDQYELGKDAISLEALLRIGCALDIDLSLLIAKAASPA